MSVASPPRPRHPSGAVDREKFEALVEALIEEARQRAQRRRRRYAGATLLVLLGGLALSVGLTRSVGAGLRSADDSSRGQANVLRAPVRNGPLTILTTVGHDGIATVEAVGAGRPKVLWHCPGGYFCGEPVSHAWSPDGRRLALTLNEITLNLPYPLALHVIDLKSGRDIQIPRQPSSSNGAAKALGCWPPTELAWSPDGTRLAYRCSPLFPGRWARGLVVLHLNARTYRNGADMRTIPTAGPAFWPSWSPGGTRIAYSTGRTFTVHPAIYVVNLDGSDRRLLARGAIAPAWSPDGSRIAYESSCGLRLVTPAGQDVTPTSSGRCQAIGPVGLPNWSPDGRKIAIETTNGIYVVNVDGTQLHLASRRTSGVLDLSLEDHGLERPSWRPRP